MIDFDVITPVPWQDNVFVYERSLLVDVGIGAHFCFCHVNCQATVV